MKLMGSDKEVQLCMYFTNIHAYLDTYLFFIRNFIDYPESDCCSSFKYIFTSSVV